MSNVVGRSPRFDMAGWFATSSFFANADCRLPVPSMTTMRFDPNPRAMITLGRTNAAAINRGRRMVMMMNIFRRTACRYSRLNTAKSLFMRSSLWRAPREPLQENAEVAGIGAGVLLLFVEDARRVELQNIRRAIRRRVDFVRARHVRFGRDKAIDDRAVQRDRQRRLRRH